MKCERIRFAIFLSRWGRCALAFEPVRSLSLLVCDFSLSICVAATRPSAQRRERETSELFKCNNCSRLGAGEPAVERERDGERERNNYITSWGMKETRKNRRAKSARREKIRSRTTMAAAATAATATAQRRSR